MNIIIIRSQREDDRYPSRSSDGIEVFRQHNVKYSSINEALGHAPRSVEATSAQLHLTEILSDAEYIESRPPKYGDKNQKKFSKMLLLKWKSSRVLVGQRKTSRDLELYYISGGQKNKAVR